MTNELDFKIIKDLEGNIVGYKLKHGIKYYSERYKKTVTVERGYISDGASGPAEDVISMAWWVHDKLCDTWEFDDGTPCSNRQASAVLHDILKSEGRWFRCKSWFIATWIFGPLGRLLK